MPESPLVQIETIALNDLEALIADPGQGRVRDRAGVPQADRTGGERVPGGRATARLPSTRSTTRPWRPSMPAPANRSSRPSSATRRRPRTSMPDQAAERRAVKERASQGQEGQGRDRLAGAGVLRGLARRGYQVATRYRGRLVSQRSASLHVRRRPANFLLKRCGKLAAAVPPPPAMRRSSPPPRSRPRSPKPGPPTRRPLHLPMRPLPHPRLTTRPAFRRTTPTQRRSTSFRNLHPPRG